jgi:hypothetical protein
MEGTTRGAQDLARGGVLARAVLLGPQNGDRRKTLGHPVTVDENGPQPADRLFHFGRRSARASVDDHLERRQIPLLQVRLVEHIDEHAGSQERRRDLLPLHHVERADDLEVIKGIHRQPGTERWNDDAPARGKERHRVEEASGALDAAVGENLDEQAAGFGEPPVRGRDPLGNTRRTGSEPEGGERVGIDRMGALPRLGARQQTFVVSGGSDSGQSPSAGQRAAQKRRRFGKELGVVDHDTRIDGVEHLVDFLRRQSGIDSEQSRAVFEGRQSSLVEKLGPFRGDDPDGVPGGETEAVQKVGEAKDPIEELGICPAHTVGHQRHPVRKPATGVADAFAHLGRRARLRLEDGGLARFTHEGAKARRRGWSPTRPSSEYGEKDDASPP